MEQIKQRPAITMDSVQSSQIEKIGHDPETNTLSIQFKAKVGRGSIYHYQNFTQDEFAAFKNAESIGSHFKQHIKPFTDKYPYEKIEDPQPEAEV